MGRGVARTKTFLDDHDRIIFLNPIGDQVKEELLIVHAYCLMDNHYHLLYETPKAGLGRTMQKVLSTYVRGFNKRYQRVGRLWQDRYKAIWSKTENISWNVQNVQDIYTLILKILPIH